MCDPVTIGSIALTGAGIAANSIAAGEAAAARDEALAAERHRQAQFDQQLAEKNAQSLNRYDNIEGQQAQKSNEIGDYLLNQVKPQTPQEQPAQQNDVQSQSNVTVQNEARKKAEAQSYSDQQAQALGKYRSFGDVLSDLSRGVGRDTAGIGQLAGFKSGSNNALNLELADASHAGDGMGTLGSVLTGLGGIGINAGLSGGGAKLANMFKSAAPAVPTAGIGLLY